MQGAGRGFVKINELMLWIIIFSIFTFALTPSTYVGDSSLFAAASFSLGSAHPPGYPLYILAGKFMTFLPLGNVAFRVNLVSAIFGVLTSVMVYKTSMELTKNRHASWAASFMCALSPLLFKESLKAEVYTMNSFLSMVVFYLGLRMLTRKKELQPGQFFSYSLLGSFIIGLGMGNHHTIGFMGPIFLLPVIMNWRKITFKLVILCILCFFTGFSVNTMLYLRSIALVKQGGLILYSYAGTPEAFIKIFLRKVFGGPSSVEAIEGIKRLDATWINGVKNSIRYVVFYNAKFILPFLFIGLIMLRKNLGLLAYFVFSFALWFGVLSKITFGSPDPDLHDIQTISVYFMPSLPILYSVASIGFARVITFFADEKWEVLPKLIPTAITLLPLVVMPSVFATASLNNNFIAYDYGRDMLTVLPVKSLLLNYGDSPMFTTFYLRSVERLREDILVINAAGKKDNYGLESSPYWKYARLYPEFYRRQKSTIRELNRDFALKGKLFASGGGFTQTVSEHYSFYPYVTSLLLYPKDSESDAKRLKAEIRDKFRATYAKINFERLLQLPLQDDFLVKELQNKYSLTTMVLASFLKRGGDREGRDKLYARAFALSDSLAYLGPYINFLLREKQDDEAFYLINSLKKAKGPVKDFAKTLEQKTISAIQDRGLSNGGSLHRNQ